MLLLNLISVICKTCNRSKSIKRFKTRRLTGAKRLPAHNKGVPCSEEMKQRIAKKLAGAKATAEAKRNISTARYKRWANVTPEYRKSHGDKISATKQRLKIERAQLIPETIQ